jgi:uncharacterized protein
MTRAARLAALLLASAAPAAAQDNLTDRPAIVVLGRGQAELPPDMFEVYGDFEGRGATQVEALRGLAEAQERLREALPRMEGLERSRLFDTAPGVFPVQDADCIAARPQDRQNCPVTGFVARAGMTLEGAPADRGGSAASLMAERGALNTRVQSTRLTTDRDLQLQARQAAFADARRQAEALAAASGHRLGRILRIQEPGATQPPPPPAPPALPRPEVIVSGVRLRPAVPLDFTPPPVRVEARLTVVFEIN